MRRRLKGSVAILILMAFTAMAQVQDRGTDIEARQLVREALAHIKKVGTKKAFEDFSAPGGSWHKKDIYLFCYRMDGTAVCLGYNRSLIGQNLMEFKNSDGRHPVEIMVETVLSGGSGWIDYEWLHPQTKRPQMKHSFIAKIPGYDGFIGAGVYK